MGISISNPAALVLLPAAIGFIWFAARKDKSFKSRFISAVRSIICMLLIFALSGLGINVYTDVSTTIFAADISDSINSRQKDAEKFIKDALANKSDKDYAGVIAFGGSAVVEINPAKEIFIENFTSFAEKDATDIDKALKTAVSIMSDETEKRVVLISDGLETQGEAEKSAANLFNNGVAVDAYMLESNITDEVQAAGISTPPYMDKNTMYDIEASVFSMKETAGALRIYKGSSLAVEEKVNLRKGENNFIFSDISNEGGGIIYRLEIEAEEDTFYENNKAYSYTYVEDTPKALIVENKDGSGRELRKILESSKLKVEVISESEAPKSVEGLNIFDAVILADISAENLSGGFMDALESFVKTAGGGLLTTGGENSYGLGGYKGTALERILPVDMDLETEGEKPDLGMVMVIDRSGSMAESSYGLSRMEMAKEAAVRAVETMEEADSVGVIGFDDKPVWYAEMQKIGGNKAAISEEIGKIQSAGGTSILPALEEAYNVLSKTDCKTKHIILLTDGQAETSGYDSLIGKMKESGITLSTVAVGSGADTALLESLALNGGGRYYFTNAFTDLPQIFTKETSLAGKEYIKNGNFYPKAGDTSAILDGIEETAQLSGYIRTTPKPRADVVLKSDDDEPILASWQYGLGRAASWTSDANGRWSGEWLGSDAGVNVLKNTVSWIMRSNISREVVFSARKSGEDAVVTASMPYDENIKSVTAVIAGADNSEITVDMKSVSPGIYEGTAEGIGEGGYIISLLESMKDGTSRVERGGFNIPYSKEYDMAGIEKGKALIERLVSKTGGRMLSDPTDVFEAKHESVFKTMDLFMPFVALALILLLFEIAFRRFSVLSESVEKAFLSIAKHNKKHKDMQISEPVNQERIKKEDKRTPEPQMEEKESTLDMLIKSKKKRN